MRSRAMRSSSRVGTPGAAAPARASRVSTTMRQARCIFCSSAQDFWTLKRAPSRLGLDDLLELAEHRLHRPIPVDVVEAGTAAVVLDQRRRARVVLGQPPGHRRLLVVLALDETGPVAVAQA